MGTARVCSREQNANYGACAAPRCGRADTASCVPYATWHSVTLIGSFLQQVRGLCVCVFREVVDVLGMLAMLFEARRSSCVGAPLDFIACR